MKDILRRILSIALPWAGLATIGRYMMQGTQLVKDYLMSYNYIVLGGLVIVLLAFLLQFGILTVAAKWLKARAVVMGLLVILIAYYCIVNDAGQYVFAGDILTVIGVLMVYLPLAGLIVTEKTQQKITESKQVIIEV